jgi:hypothetical protein
MSDFAQQLRESETQIKMFVAQERSKAITQNVDWVKGELPTGLITPVRVFMGVALSMAYITLLSLYFSEVSTFGMSSLEFAVVATIFFIATTLKLASLVLSLFAIFVLATSGGYRKALDKTDSRYLPISTTWQDTCNLTVGTIKERKQATITYTVKGKQTSKPGLKNKLSSFITRPNKSIYEQSRTWTFPLSEDIEQASQEIVLLSELVARMKAIPYDEDSQIIVSSIDQALAELKSSKHQNRQARKALTRQIKLTAQGDKAVNNALQKLADETVIAQQQEKVLKQSVQDLIEEAQAQQSTSQKDQ